MSGERAQQALLREDAALGVDSLYARQGAAFPAAPPLQGAQRADVAVVGGGLCGLSTALELRARGLDVRLLEARTLGAGASGRNGGQALVGYASGQGVFERQLGQDGARQAWAMSLEAVDMLERRVREHRIDCDWTRGYLYLADTPRHARRLRAELEHLQDRYDLPVQLAEGDALGAWIRSPRYRLGGLETLSGQLHPLRYTAGLARAAAAAGVRLHGCSAVSALNRRGDGRLELTCPSGQVSADFVVLAGNATLAAQAPGLAPALAARVMPVGTYIGATAPLPPELVRRLMPVAVAASDNRQVLDYFRFDATGRLLFGGRASYSTRTPAGLRQTLQARMAAVFPPLRQQPIEHLWGGFVDITLNRAPDFGRLAPNVYYLQGFSGHGVALSGLAGRLVAEAVGQQAARFDLFARLRHRAFPGGPRWRTPVLMLGMAWARLRDLA